MQETIDVFAIRNIAAISLASVGFLATIWWLTVANYRSTHGEREIQAAKDALKDAPTIETNVE